MRFRVTAVLLFALLALAFTTPVRAQEEKDWGYNKGFYFHTPQFELKISTRTQFRYTYGFFDDLSASEDRGEFTLPRTRLRLDGFAYYPWLKYKIQYDFTGQTYTTTGTSTRRGPDLRDLISTWRRTPGPPSAWDSSRPRSGSRSRRLPETRSSWIAPSPRRPSPPPGSRARCSGGPASKRSGATR